MNTINGSSDYRRILWGVIVALVFVAYGFSFAVLNIVDNRLGQLNDSVIRLLDTMDVRVTIVEKQAVGDNFRIGYMLEQMKEHLEAAGDD